MFVQRLNRYISMFLVCMARCKKLMKINDTQFDV